MRGVLKIFFYFFLANPKIIPYFVSLLHGWFRA